MLPEVGASELMVLAAVALIVVGPKDLPVLFRKLGQFMTKLRGMAAEFRTGLDEMARQSELDELRNEVKALRDTAADEIAKPVSEFKALQGDIVSEHLYGDYNADAAAESSETVTASEAPEEQTAPPAAPARDPQLDEMRP